MEPRHKTTKKWTAFPADFTSQVLTALKQNFPKKSEAGTFKVEGRIYPAEILLRLGYLESGRLRQLNFETSVDFVMGRQQALDQIYLCVDAAAQMMADYFEVEDKGEEESLDYPVTWKEIEFNKKKVFVQFSTVNSDLEEEANRLLGDFEADLVKGSAEDDEDYPGDDDDTDDNGDENIH